MDRWKRDMFKYVAEIFGKLSTAERTPKSPSNHLRNVGDKINADPRNEIYSQRFLHLFSSNSENTMQRMDFHKACLAINPNTSYAQIEELFEFSCQGKDFVSEESFVEFLDIHWSNWMDAWKDDMIDYVEKAYTKVYSKKRGSKRFGGDLSGPKRTRQYLLDFQQAVQSS